MKIPENIIEILSNVSNTKIIVVTLSLILLLCTVAFINEWRKDKEEQRRRNEIEWFQKMKNRDP